MRCTLKRERRLNEKCCERKREREKNKKVLEEAKEWERERERGRDESTKLK